MKKNFPIKIIFLFAAVVIGILLAVRSCALRVEPDIILTYIGENYFSSDVFYDAAPALEEAVDDVNLDGERTAELVTVAFGSNLTQAQEQNNLTKLTMSIGGGESRIYIMDKAYCERYADSDFFADVSEFSAGGKALINAEGKTYGLCVEGNPLLERLGLSDTEDVYLALRAVTEMDGVNFKNIDAVDVGARKLYQYIINNNINN